MTVCTGISAIHLMGLAFTFLIAVLSLDALWVRVPEELHQGNIAGAFRKRQWLNLFVAIGAAGSAVLLLVWVSSCSGAVF